MCHVDCAEEKVLNHKRKLYASYQRLLKREGIADGKKGSPPTQDDDDDDDANEATRIEDVKADEDFSDDGTGSEGEQQVEHGGEEDGDSSDEEGDGGDEVKPSSRSSGGDGGSKKGRPRPAKPDSLYKAKMIAEAKKKAIEEAKRKRQEKLEARERSEKQRRERYKTMTKKTRRGQPVMKTQLSALLEKIKSTS